MAWFLKKMLLPVLMVAGCADVGVVQEDMSVLEVRQAMANQKPCPQEDARQGTYGGNTGEMYLKVLCVFSNAIHIAYGGNTEADDGGIIFVLAERQNNDTYAFYAWGKWRTVELGNGARIWFSIKDRRFPMKRVGDVDVTAAAE